MFDLTRPGWRRRLTLLVIAVHRLVYRASGGRVLGHVAGMPVLLLTTTGRRSGRLRTTPLTYLRDGGDLVLVASAGGSDRSPAWSLNLEAQPDVVVRVGRAEEHRRARRANPEERERLWVEIVATYRGYASYQARTARQIPVYLLTTPATPAPSDAVNERGPRSREGL